MKAVIILSRTFLSNHPKAGEFTYFAKKLKCEEKIHTCRSNYEYWKRQIEKMIAVGGYLSIRQWQNKPYRSPQIEIERVPPYTFGIQKLTLEKVTEYGEETFTASIDGRPFALKDLAENDGLSVQDFTDWFLPAFKKKKTKILEFAIIHFTSFRY